MSDSHIQIIEFKGQKIVQVDFTGVEMEEVMAILDRAKTVVAKEAHKSVRHLTIVTGTSFSKEIIQGLKEYAVHNDPYVFRSAVVGVEGLAHVLFSAVVKFSKRKNLVLRNTIEEAKEWLCEEAERR